MKTTFKNLSQKIVFLMFSMFITSFGIVVMIQSNFGLNPWWTFTFGFSNATGLSYGLVVQLFSVVLILGAIFLGVKPGIATFMDMMLIGFFVDFILNLNVIPVQHTFIFQLLMSFVGLIVFCFGVFLTITIGLGTGPKDSFTFALMYKTKKSISQMKLIVESIIFVIGALLGGPFGIGTVIATVATGGILKILFKLFDYTPQEKSKNLLA